MSVSPSMPVVVRPADARTRSPLARATVAEPCVRVDPATAFQLARFAVDERVRDAAAESLWPREYVDRCDIEASDGDFATVPFAERVVALLGPSAVSMVPGAQCGHCRSGPLASTPQSGGFSGGSSSSRAASAIRSPFRRWGRIS